MHIELISGADWTLADPAWLALLFLVPILGWAAWRGGARGFGWPLALRSAAIGLIALVLGGAAIETRDVGGAVCVIDRRRRLGKRRPARTRDGGAARS